MDKDESTEAAARLIQSFDALPLEKRLEVFSQLSPEARQELVRVVPHADEIIRRVSEEEMFFTIKRLGEENALALISLMTGRQLQYALDLDLWKNEMFDYDAATRWLNIMARIGEEKILHFMQVSDPELAVTVMKGLIGVVIRDPEIDILEQKDSLPSFTLDDIFFVHFNVPGSEDMVISLLEALFSWNTEYYFTLMEELARGIPLENEEAARKARLARLADRGFPEFDEALEIYRYLRRGGLSNWESQPSSIDTFHDETGGSLLEYPLKVIETDSLFKRCLDEVADAYERDRISQELAHMANKVIVADAKDPGSKEDIHSSLRKVSGYINIALEESCGADQGTALRLVQANHMEMLFRRGFSIIMDVRKQAQKLVRNYAGGVENLGHPLAGLVHGLMQKRPLYAANVLGQEKAREFESMDDILRIRNLLDTTSIEESWEPI
jgi:hypothetical protein